MSRAWKMAVDWVASENESRLRVETQRVKGQDHIVWRWVQVILFIFIIFIHNYLNNE